MDTDELDQENEAEEAVTEAQPEVPAAGGDAAEEPAEEPAEPAEEPAEPAEEPAEPAEEDAALDPAAESAEEPAAPDPESMSAEEHAAWQLTLPDVDPDEGAPEGVPLDEVAEDAGAVDEAGAEVAEVAEPSGDDEPLFDLPAPDADALAAIEASIAEIPEVGEVVGAQEKSSVPWWPYLVYIGLWVVFGIAMVVLSNRLGDPYLPESGAYPPLLLGGLLLAVIGPLTGVAGWGIARRSLAKEHRSGLLSAALLRAAAFTLGGVALWWAALVLVDALRLGWI